MNGGEQFLADPRIASSRLPAQLFSKPRKECNLASSWTACKEAA